MSDLKNNVEALLFSSGRKMEVEEIAAVCKADEKEVLKELEELKKEYGERDSALMVIDEGKSWKITVREAQLGVVQAIITETELTRQTMETLAVIAFKNPAMQADIIKIRGNKAYDHMKELEEMGYVMKEKSGRTFKIKLTQKFFDYFDLPPNKIKEEFQDFNELEKAIEEKEQELSERIEQKEEVKKQMIEQIKKEKEEEKHLESGSLDLDEDDDSVEREDEELAEEEEIDQEKEVEKEEVAEEAVEKEEAEKEEEKDEEHKQQEQEALEKEERTTDPEEIQEEREEAKEERE